MDYSKVRDAFLCIISANKAKLLMRTRYTASALALLVTAALAAPFADFTMPTPIQSARRSVRGARAQRGRPRKFNRPARAVTLTLPEDIIAALQAIDKDVSRAVVRAVQPLVDNAPRPVAELTSIGVVVVPPSRAFRERVGVELVPLFDGRALISFDEQVPISEIELRLRDAIDDPTCDAEARQVFEEIVEILSTARRTEGVSLQRRSIIIVTTDRQSAEAAEKLA
jgi:hypothetical protein